MFNCICSCIYFNRLSPFKVPSTFTVSQGSPAIGISYAMYHWLFKCKMYKREMQSEHKLSHYPAWKCIVFQQRIIFIPTVNKQQLQLDALTVCHPKQASYTIKQTSWYKTWVNRPHFCCIVLKRSQKTLNLISPVWVVARWHELRDFPRDLSQDHCAL